MGISTGVTRIEQRVQDPETGAIRTTVLGWSVRWGVSDRAGHAWQVEALVVEEGGRLTVRALAIYPPAVGSAVQGQDFFLEGFAHSVEDRPHPPGGLTTAWLRRVALGQAMAEVRRVREFLWSERYGQLRPRRDERLALFPRERQRGRPLEEEELAEVAERYLEAVARNPRRVLRRMLEDYHRQGATEVTYEMVRDRVRLARRHGFLPPAPRRGMVTDGPTEKLLEWREKRRGSSRRKEG